MGLPKAAALAWRLLLHDRGRFATSLGGIAFAVLLMLIQMGFRNSLLDSATALLNSLDGDAFVVHKEKDYTLARESLPRLRLEQALSAPGVAAAYPLWIDLHFWKNLEDGTLRPIRVLGIRPGDPVFALEDVRAQARALERPDTALLDRRSRSYYGRIGPGPAQVQRTRLEIVGTFAMATDLEADGNLIVNDATFARIGHVALDRLEMIVLKLAPGAFPERALAGLRAVLPGDVKVGTKQDLLRMDRLYWDTGTPVSLVVLIGMTMGFVVGIVICYQILYTEVADHLPEFATLKAIGYGNAFLVQVVLMEALALSLIGLLPSLLAGAALYSLLGAATGLLLRFTWARVGFVALVTLAMCVFAGALALRKVLQADPAELF